MAAVVRSVALAVWHPASALSAASGLCLVVSVLLGGLCVLAAAVVAGAWLRVPAAVGLRLEAGRDVEIAVGLLRSWSDPYLGPVVAPLLAWAVATAAPVTVAALAWHLGRRLGRAAKRARRAAQRPPIRSSSSSAA